MSDYVSKKINSTRIQSKRNKGNWGGTEIEIRDWSWPSSGLRFAILEFHKAQLSDTGLRSKEKREEA